MLAEECVRGRVRRTRGPDDEEFVPDLILTDLAQLPSCVTSARRARRSDLPWQHAMWGAYASRVQPFG